MNREPLTESEHEVIELRIAGKSFREIAVIRQCAFSTVRVISSTACRKLGVRKSTNPETLGKALTNFNTRPFNPMNDPAFL